MLEDAHAHLPREIQPASVLFETVHHAQALRSVMEAGQAVLAREPVQHALAHVAERCVAEVVAQRYRLRQILVEPQRARDSPRNLRNLERMRQPRPVMVALRKKKDLSLIFEPAERFAVDNPVPVALEAGAYRARLLVPLAPAAV